MHFTSTLAASSMLAPLLRSTSVSSCSDGSISTFWVTSPSSEAITSLISLCCLITWPPLQQLRACSTPFALPLPTFVFARKRAEANILARGRAFFQSSWLARSKAVPSAATYRQKSALRCISRTCALAKRYNPERTYWRPFFN